jgi:hypothetical protein
MVCQNYMNIMSIPICNQICLLKWELTTQFHKVQTSLSWKHAKCMGLTQINFKDIHMGPFIVSSSIQVHLVMHDKGLQDVNTIHYSH